MNVRYDANGMSAQEVRDEIREFFGFAEPDDGDVDEGDCYAPTDEADKFTAAEEARGYDAASIFRPSPKPAEPDALPPGTILLLIELLKLLIERFGKK